MKHLTCTLLNINIKNHNYKQNMGIATNARLAVSDGPLETEYIAQLIPSDLSLPISELRGRYQRDGYLFVKHLLPRSDVLAAREAYFKLLTPTGVLKEGSPPVSGIFNPLKSPDEFPGIGAGSSEMNGRPGDERAAMFVDLALKAHTDDWYAEVFCKHPRLLQFVAELTGWGENTLALKRTLLRNNVPGTKPIGVHYDQIFLRYGEATSVTAWVPIGDVKIDGGGLIYLENGTQLLLALHCRFCALQTNVLGSTIGQELEDEFTRKAKASGLTDEQAKSAFNQNMMSTGLLSEKPAEFAQEHNRRWLVSAFEAGDVVLHQPFAVCITRLFIYKL